MSIVMLVILVSHASSAVVEGIILTQQGPLENGRILAYDNYQSLINGTPSYISEAGENKGFVKLELPPGIYYLTAAGRFDGKDYFSFHGANPITVEDNNLWVPFMVLPKNSAAAKISSSTKLSGEITFKGRPVRGAQVSIYPLSNINFRGMGFLTGTTDGSGIFNMNVEPGEYVVVARKRKNFRGLRPLKKGDLFCYLSSNPVTIKYLENTQVRIPCYPKDDLQAFLNEEIYPSILVKKSGEDSIRFRENKLEKAGDLLEIQGRVTGLSGEPMKDIYVMAYRGKNETMFQMHNIRTMPEYMVKTDDNGYYTIEADKRGAYYMVARELIGEAPAKGENYGLYEGNTNHAVVLDKDSVNTIDIIVSKMMTNKNELRVRRQELRVESYEYAEDTVINRDTVWVGEIVINGTIHVARGSTLTINPGTSVKFRRIDNNHDGVGDGKIRVSGRLIAEGTPERMIIFTSAEEKPRKMDWSYLLFFVSEDENIVKHCLFKYAFTGVQVHFSNAVVTDSLFTGNHEAIRFGRTELTIDHNDILSNDYGIRYTRLEGPVKILNNNILNNDIGIFHVPSNQNIVDFSDTFDKKDVLHRHQPLITYNNIANNDEYNFRLGERQGYNMLLKHNWWGGNDDESIKEMIFDERPDGTLGRVIYKPYLEGPDQNAGIRRDR